MRENERRRRVAEGMRDLLAVVNSTRSLDEILDSVLAQAADLLGSDAGSVLLLDGREGEQGVLTVRASRALVVGHRAGAAAGRDGGDRAGGRARADGGGARSARSDPRRSASLTPLVEQRTGYLELQRIGYPGSDLAPNLPRVRDIARYYRGLLAVPLAVRGRMQGAITLYYRRPRQFTREDVRLGRSVRRPDRAGHRKRATARALDPALARPGGAVSRRRGAVSLAAAGRGAAGAGRRGERRAEGRHDLGAGLGRASRAVDPRRDARVQTGSRGQDGALDLAKASRRSWR